MEVTEHERHPGRGLIGLAILGIPIVLVVFVLVAYSGLFALGLGGRGGTVPTTLSFTGCPAARPLVAARLDDMGYAAVGSDLPDGFAFTFDGPADPVVRASLPADLARTGRFEVREQGEVLATEADVTSATVRVDALMVPTTLVALSPEAAGRVGAVVRERPGGALDFYVDGERVGGQTHQAVGVGEVEIAPPITDDGARLRATAAWAVVIDHAPLPCPVAPRAP